MAKILFLISVIFLNSYLTEQANIIQGDKVEKNRGIVTDLSKIFLETRGVEAATKSNMMYKTRNPKYVIDNRDYKEFDARKRWPKCKTIGEVHNEGNFAFGWAYAAAGVLADRTCIATNGGYNKLLSTEELISCSGIKETNGNVNERSIWEYLKSHGVVSGGKYNSNDGCQPFKFPPIANILTHLQHTCDDHCYGNTSINYNHDHVRVRNYYTIRTGYIQKEVQTYGPVAVQFKVCDDFLLYKSGVYVKSDNAKVIRTQYAKLIGWGVENGVDYWLVINSWGHEWGQKGLFKIKRGTNQCGVESVVYAGVPEIK
ncbi:cathepsin B-like cysteine proteinase 3 [Acyrthosiphon pisum]|uniref:Peptidase C1A papain C-terminal domain-containing protein n=1 Tax=Acyrthosiphon pisum TaxID=7029 RepID=A0A8R1VZU9_ACYPI|nr:cathepsin B-like cysteine proteinase 3 [Acyrthosiphon pisum]|eukprot:XP_001945855.1 PREDICTED: cathepsin B-like cysteine proteinase 3 [Acyrthosiphon pisum]